MTKTHRKKVGVRYHCDACRKDVTDIARIQCAECEDFDICVECFASGIQVATHCNDHSYRVVDTLNFPIFEEKWGAEEELLLMEGLEKYGMGNWSDVADHVGTKTMREVEEHYYNVFVNSKEWPLPEIQKIEFSLNKLLPIKNRLIIQQQNNLLSTSSLLPNTSANIRSELIISKKMLKPQTSLPCNHEVAGYMPGRCEFETDYGTEIDELFLKEFEFLPTDSIEETNLKLIIAEIYNAKTDRKYERKRLIQEYGLVEVKRRAIEEKRKSKEDVELFNSFRSFCRMQTLEDYQKLIEGFQVELALKKQIERLQEYRYYGIRTFSSAEQFERDKAAKENIISIPPALLPPPPIPVKIIKKEEIEEIKIIEEIKGGAILKQIGRRPVAPLDFTEFPNFELLNPDEQILCSTLRLLPQSYLAIKSVLLSEAIRLGSLRRRRARELVSIDVNKTSKIYNFFVASGWIRPRIKAFINNPQDDPTKLAEMFTKAVNSSNK